MKAQLALILIAACGGGSTSNPDAPKSTIDAPGAIDAKIFMDAPPVVNNNITVSGIASASGQTTSTPLAGVVVGFYKTGNDTAIATMTTTATGAYTFSIPTNGMVVDGYLKATKSGYADNFLYPAAPLQADFPMADSNLVTTSDFSGLTILTGQMSTNGFIAATVLDATGTAVMGAKVTSTPASGSYAYSDSNGIPTSTTGTNTDGRAFFINVPPGAPVAISATKTGTAFKSHSLTGHPNALTTTIIIP
jgi:hypothetical protein